jgi:hypothetical protein
MLDRSHDASPTSKTEPVTLSSANIEQKRQQVAQLLGKLLARIWLKSQETPADASRLQNEDEVNHGLERR